MQFWLEEYGFFDLSRLEHCYLHVEKLFELTSFGEIWLSSWLKDKYDQGRDYGCVYR